jgi:hypothetical protein
MSLDFYFNNFPICSSPLNGFTRQTWKAGRPSVSWLLNDIKLVGIIVPKHIRYAEVATGVIEVCSYWDPVGYWREQTRACQHIVRAISRAARAIENQFAARSVRTRNHRVGRRRNGNIADL